MINDYEATHDITDQDFKQPAEEMSNDDVISTLNNLIETCRDGQEGFKEAAEGVERSDLKSIFYEFSQQRSEFVGVLQQLVRSLGGEPETSGSTAGAIHRGWIDIKSAVMGRDEEAILNECELGEDSAKETYLEAQKSNLPANVADIVDQQAQAVLAAHNRIRSLRNSSSQSATGLN
ncbi:MAG: PA2169 family four-helix-bundle protein [Pyrinomonadaceae bacterium]